MTKKAILFAILILFLFMFYSLSKQIYDSLRSSYRLDESTDQVAALQQENTELKKRLTHVDSPEFIEQQARDKLNLARPNETVVIIPQSQIDRLVNSQAPANPAEPIPNWQGWLKLFF